MTQQTGYESLQLKTAVHPESFSPSDRGDETILAVRLKHRRGYGWLGLLAAGIYFVILSAFYLHAIHLIPFNLQADPLKFYPFLALGLVLVLAGLGWWLFSGFIIVPPKAEGVYSSFGRLQKNTLKGMSFLPLPWSQVEYLVDTSTEFSYTVPAVTFPTRENIPVTMTDLLVKFRIADAVQFVQALNAENLDMILQSAVQDMIRQRLRQTATASAYRLRGSQMRDDDGSQMQNDAANRPLSRLKQQLAKYGVQVLSLSIPDVILPEQYRTFLAQKERAVQEKTAYIATWEFTSLEQTNACRREIETARRECAEWEVRVQEARAKARQKASHLLQQARVEAENIRKHILAEGCAAYFSARKEAQRIQKLGEAYRENPELLEYELTRLELEVAEQLSHRAPRPIIINDHREDSTALSTVLLAQILPHIAPGNEAGPGLAVNIKPESGEEP